MTPGLPDPGDLRAKAAATRQRAQMQPDPEYRKALVMLASEYDRLADAIERELNHRRPSNENDPDKQPD